MSKRNLLLAVATVVLVASCIGYLVFQEYSRATVAVSEETRSSASFSPVVPKRLPSGFTVADKPSYISKSNIIISRYAYKDSFVTVSQQKRPDTDLKQVDAQDTFLINAGAVYVLKGEKGRIQAIVETRDSWLLVNANESMEYEVFKVFLESLRTS